jgi:hypothetical protein
MPEPQIYDAASVAMSATTAMIRDYVPPKDRIEERDAIWNFEQIPGAMQEQADLRNWMLKTKDVRMSLVKTWTSQLSKQEGEDPTSLGIRRQKLRRRFLFIIATEANSALGSRDVAAEAFKAVFPKE